MNKEIVSNVQEKFKIVSDQNEDLRGEVKKLKAKNTFIQIIGGVTGTKATDMVEDLAALILSKSVIGEEFLVETDDIKVQLYSYKDYL